MDTLNQTEKENVENNEMVGEKILEDDLELDADIENLPL
jgi:hypothetical protein